MQCRAPVVIGVEGDAQNERIQAAGFVRAHESLHVPDCRLFIDVAFRDTSTALLGPRDGLQRRCQGATLAIIGLTHAVVSASEPVVLSACRLPILLADLADKTVERSF